jgi:hypothetical protein
MSKYVPKHLALKHIKTDKKWCLFKILNTQNYWFFGLCPSLIILKTKEHNWFCFRPQAKGEIPTVLGLVERANLNHWTIPVSMATAMKMPETGLCRRKVTL